MLPASSSVTTLWAVWPSGAGAACTAGSRPGPAPKRAVPDSGRRADGARRSGGADGARGKPRAREGSADGRAFPFPTLGEGTRERTATAVSARNLMHRSNAIGLPSLMGARSVKVCAKWHRVRYPCPSLLSVKGAGFTYTSPLTAGLTREKQVRRPPPALRGGGAAERRRRWRVEYAPKCAPRRHARTPRKREPKLDLGPLRPVAPGRNRRAGIKNVAPASFPRYFFLQRGLSAAHQP